MKTVILIKPIVLTALKLFELHNFYYAMRVEPWNVVFIAFHPVLGWNAFLFCNYLRVVGNADPYEKEIYYYD